MLSTLSCGKRQPPLPPIEKTAQRVEITGTQRGNIIMIESKLPARNASVSSVLSIQRADVYRLAEPSNAPLTLSEEDFASRSTLIFSVPITDEDFSRRQLTFTDGLEFSGQKARLRYAIRLVNASGQKAAFSNFLLIEPTAKVARNPTALTAKISEQAITLRWEAPSENVDGSQPANIVGYNVYRVGEEISAKILNQTPVTSGVFRDEFFEFGKDYSYYTRTISLGGDGEPIESANSNSASVEPRDTFAPSAPSAVTIAAAPGNLSIFFAVNPEKDVAGYRVYRSTERSEPFSEWILLTDNLLTTNTFQDKKVTSGEVYFYYLTAVDKNGNVSDNSLVVSETAP
ncbi:MAG: hypothetical protein LH614_11410 [Pyrinomonadaceae bacterium]|nr:hypothetical protein [Pyrinomonadaceae bacterium]